MDASEEYDVFVSHAWEDKAAFVTELVDALTARGLRVWYDDLSLDIGDSLRESIDRGLRDSRYGVVVLSPHFFAKQWPARELNGLVQKAMGEGRKVVLPVWHHVTRDHVAEYSYPLADLVAANSADGVDAVADAILRVVSSSGEAGAAVTASSEGAEQKLVASARKVIADPTQVVAVTELTDAVAREAFGALKDQYQVNLEKWRELPPGEILGRQREAIRATAKLCALGANLGHPDHYGAWERAVAIIARDPGRSADKRLHVSFWQYPSAVLLYAIGVAALQRRRLDLVAITSLKVRVYDPGRIQSSPLVHSIRWDEIGKLAESAHATNYKTPLSEDIFLALQDWVLEYFVDEDEYERTFDLFEFSIAMARLATADDRHAWVPPARYMLKCQWDAGRIDAMASELEGLGIVDLYFDGDGERYTEAVNYVKEIISKTPM